MEGKSQQNELHKGGIFLKTEETEQEYIRSATFAYPLGTIMLVVTSIITVPLSLLGIIVWAWDTWHTLDWIWSIELAVVVVVFTIWIPWKFLLNLFPWVLSEYRILPEGVLAKFPLRKAVLVPWEDFQQVCICYLGLESQRSIPKTGYPIIVCVKKGERKNLYGHWKTGNPFHYRSIFSMDYTPELHEKVASCYPGYLEDLRDRGNYRL